MVIGTIGGLARFSDGNIYIGIHQSGVFLGVKRYILSTSTLEEKAWMAGAYLGVNIDSYFSLYKFGDRTTGGICIEQFGDTWSNRSNPLCEVDSGQAFEQVMQFEGKLNFVVAKSFFQGPYPSQLWQFFPTVEPANIKKTTAVVLAVQAGKNIILSGLDSSKRNVLTLYNPVSKQETVVMDGSIEVEIFSMTYSQKKNAVMFSGLRFSDNKFVVGEVSLG